MADDFHLLQQKLDSALLDIYEGDLDPAAVRQLNAAWRAIDADAGDGASHALAVTDIPLDDAAARIGESRSLLQHLAALEMLREQRAGHPAEAQGWRVLITLPKFANADDGGILLQQQEVRQPDVTEALAKEYIGWQATRTRQLMDRFQRIAARGDANAACVRANLSEIRTLARFPAPLLQAAGLAVPQKEIPLPALNAPYDSPEAGAALAAWRESVEATLPNLLSTADVDRLERLLARFVELIPKEYRNGVQEGKIIIPLEHGEAVQFTQQAQGLVNELGPVWRRDHHDAYEKFHAELAEKLASLEKRIGRIEPQNAVEANTREVAAILEGRFGLSARRAGAKGQVVEETALEVRSALMNSLAAARAGHWREAESLRLDAYTSFDSEIEARVLPRNPDLGRKTERAFLDGDQNEPGIKALLDSRATMEELSAGYQRALQSLEQSVSLLRVSISPATVSFTAFTIVSREGLEAVVVLAALLAGLRGGSHQASRRWVGSGAWLALAATGVTFWLSKTLIQSLARYGEKLEAVVSILAVIILFMVTNWVFHKIYWVGWNAKLRSLSKADVPARLEWLALLGVGFLTVYREGFETTLFLQSLLLEGSSWPVVIGVSAAALFIGLLGLAIFRFGAKLPYRKLLVVTGLLVVSIMVTFVGSTVRLFQTVAWLPIHPVAWLHIPAWAGQWFGLYPSVEGLLLPPLALVYVGGAWLWVRFHSVRVEPPPLKQRREKSLQPAAA